MHSLASSVALAIFNLVGAVPVLALVAAAAMSQRDRVEQRWTSRFGPIDSYVLVTTD
jgi:hypothetical protein